MNANALVFLTALGGLASAQEGAPDARPNVVLIVVDTLRADRLGAYGYGRPTSPRIDALADRAVVFENALSCAPWTMPSMAAMLTGRAPRALGIEGEAVVLPRDAPTLAETLRDAGYSTAGVVSHFYVSAKFGFDRGFDAWDERNARGHAWISSEKVTDLALEFLRGRAADPAPFFLFAHYFDPHYDYLPHAGSELLRPYDGELVSGHDNIVELRRRARDGAYDDGDARHLSDLYDSEVRFTDEHVGRLLDELRRAGLDERTLVVLTADHGESLMERPDRWIGHTRTVFEEVVRVPLVVKPPGPPDPRRVTTPVSTLDVRSTILAAAGATDEDDAGRDLLAAPRDEAVFSETFRRRQLQVARRGRWKLIHNLTTGASSLFDLEADPLEQHDVAQAHPEHLADLERALAEWDARMATALEAARTEAPELTPEELRELEKLGY